MAQSDAPPPSRRSTAEPGQLSPRVLELLVPSLQAGFGAGAIGLLVGAASGIVRSTTPVLFSAVTGAQWFILGSSYSASRIALIRAWGGNERVSQTEKIQASALAGASAGVVGGILRGPRNILPAVAVFSVFGGIGQVVMSTMAARSARAGPKTDWLASRWSPVTAMSDEEYARYIEDKILKLDVEIALVDDRIAALKIAKDESPGDTDAKAGQPKT